MRLWRVNCVRMAAIWAGTLMRSLRLTKMVSFRWQIKASPGQMAMPSCATKTVPV